VVKIKFPGSAARQTRFTANANQSNVSFTVVKIDFQGGKNQFPRFGCPPNREFQPIK